MIFERFLESEFRHDLFSRDLLYFVRREWLFFKVMIEYQLESYF